MAESVMVYAFGKGTITPYEPSRAQIDEGVRAGKRIMQTSTLKYALVDFIRVGFGLSSLDELL